MRFLSEIKVLRIDPVFSNWVNFNKNVSIINCSTNSKSCKAIYFFRFLAFNTLFQLLVGYVFQFRLVIGKFLFDNNGSYKN